MMKDHYMIRLKADPEMYLHPGEKIPQADGTEFMETKFKKGYQGAIAFPSQQATEILEKLNTNDLEKVKVSEVIPPDGSQN